MAGNTLAYVANYHPLVGHLVQQTGMVPILMAMLDGSNQDSNSRYGKTSSCSRDFVIAQDALRSTMHCPGRSVQGTRFGNRGYKAGIAATRVTSWTLAWA